MKIQFNMDILNLIHLIQDCERFLRSRHAYYNADPQEDIDEQVLEYFNGIQLPEGIKRNFACFAAIKNFPEDALSILDNLEVNELNKRALGFMG